MTSFKMTSWAKAPSRARTSQKAIGWGITGYQKNRAKLHWRWRAHNVVLVAFWCEVIALLIHAA